MIVNVPKEIANDFKLFYQKMCEWDWGNIDDIKLPVILRGSQKFIDYTVVHIELLSKFPANVNLAQIV